MYALRIDLNDHFYRKSSVLPSSQILNGLCHLTSLGHFRPQIRPLLSPEKFSSYATDTIIIIDTVQLNVFNCHTVAK